MKTLLTTASLVAMLTAPAAWAETNLKLVEVITSPERTEVLRGLVDEYEAANPDVKVEIVSLPWGQAFEKLATMVAGGDIPDLVEMPDRWMALYSGSGQIIGLEDYLAKWDDAKTLTQKTLDVARYGGDTAYMIPYGFYLGDVLQQETPRRSGRGRAAENDGGVHGRR